MEGVWASVNQLLDEFRDSGSGGPLLRQTLGLFSSWDLTSEEEPEKSLWQWLLTTWCGWKLSLAFWDSEASESDTLVGIKNGSFPDQSLKSVRPNNIR